MLGCSELEHVTFEISQQRASMLSHRRLDVTLAVNTGCESAHDQISKEYKFVESSLMVSTLEHASFNASTTHLSFIRDDGIVFTQLNQHRYKEKQTRLGPKLESTTGKELCKSPAGFGGPISQQRDWDSTVGRERVNFGVFRVTTVVTAW